MGIPLAGVQPIGLIGKPPAGVQPKGSGGRCPGVGSGEFIVTAGMIGTFPIRWLIEMRTMLKACWPLSLLLLIGSCAVNPVTGRRELSFISESQEISIGRGEVQNSAMQIGFYPDSALTRYVAGIGQRMAVASERPHLPWEFHLLDDPMVNAFAAPGGFIFITRGILAYMNSEAELAGVIGHEIGHVTAKHSVAQMSTNMLGQVALIGGAVIANDARVLEIGAPVLGIAQLKFGRDDERQSDGLGHRYSLRAGYDVREMPKTFATLQRVSEASSGSSGNRLPTLLSTHPDPGDRVAATQAWADTVSSYQGLISNRDGFLDRLNGLVFGVDPRQGYFEGTRFLHPEMRFQFDVPSGWQTANYPIAVLAAEPNGTAQIELSTAEQASAQAAAQAFGSAQGIQVVSSGRTTLNGLPAAVVTFRASTSDNATLQGEAVFIEHRGTVFRLMGLATAAGAQAQASALNRALRSFAPTPANQAFRRVRELQVITLNTPQTADQLARASNGAATAQELALINGVDASTAMPAGRKIKTIRFR